MFLVLALEARQGPNTQDQAGGGPSDNSGRNMVSSVFITVGDADTPWPPQFFRLPAFDRLCCGRMRRAHPPRTRMSSLSCCPCLPSVPMSSRVHLSGPFKLDIVFRSSRLSTTGPRSVVDRRIQTGNSPSGRPHWCGSFELSTGTNPRTGSRRQFQADSADFLQSVCRTLGVATPHKGDNRKGGNEGESCRLCYSHPPSLVCPPLRFSWQC